MFCEYTIDKHLPVMHADVGRECIGPAHAHMHAGPI